MKRFFTKSLPLVAFAFLVATFFMPEMAFATNAARSPALENFAQTMSALVHILTAATLILLQFMPPLWGTDLITGPDIIAALKPMWMFIRNIMNMVFVIVLLAVIMINLLTSGESSNWSIKAKLGKIILGLVAVNFSLLAVKVLVDATYVGTIGLLTIADTAIDAKGTKDVQEMMDLKVDTKKYTVCKDQSAGKPCTPVRDIINDTFCKSKDPNKDYCLFKVKDKIEVDQLQDPEKKNIILAFGVHFMRLESLPILAANSKSIWAVLDNALFSFVMAVAYILALVAVFVVLIVRVVMMWVMILLSPILVTGWVLGWSGDAFQQINGRFWNYLIVPMKVAAVFAFTFVLIATLDAVVPAPQFYTEYIEPGAPLKPFWGDEKFKGWQFVWKIFIVVLFWKAVFLALKDIEDVQGVVQGIQNFGSGMAKTAMTWGADQIKIPGMGTLANVGNINQGMASARNRMRSDSGPTGLRESFTGGAQDTAKADKARNKLATQFGRNRATLQEIKSILAANGVTQSILASNTQLQTQVFSHLSEGDRTALGISSAGDLGNAANAAKIFAADTSGTPDPDRSGPTTVTFDESKLAGAIATGLTEGQVINPADFGVTSEKDFGDLSGDKLREIRTRIESETTFTIETQEDGTIKIVRKPS